MVLASPSVMALSAASAFLAPLAASGGLWVARATDPALTRLSAHLRPSSIVLACGLALGLVVAASPSSLAGFAICSCLAASAAADRDQYVLPDALTLAAVALAIAFRPFAPDAGRVALLSTGVVAYVLGALFALFMCAVRGRKAFGQGDVKLIAALAVILPAELVLTAILLGALCALASALFSARLHTRVIPLGFHLVIGAGAALLLGAVFHTFFFSPPLIPLAIG